MRWPALEGSAGAKTAGRRRASLARHPVEPGDEVAGHLVAVGLVQRLVPRARIEASGELREARRLQVRNEALDVGPDRIALAGEDVERHVLADRGEILPAGYARQRVEHVDGELGGERQAAKRIADIGVDLPLVAREPVEGGARGAERLVEAAEPHREDRVALAAPA